MNQSRGVVIVGASVAGMHAAERLRKYGYGMRIDLIEVETRLPYDRPPLSKSVLLGKATHEDIRPHGDGALAALGVELHRGVPATELRERTVCLALARVLGVRAGRLFAGLWRGRDVELRAGTQVLAIDAGDDAARVTLGDGAVIAADTVVVAIGSVLNTGWLGSVAGPAGLVCDSTGQVLEADTVTGTGAPRGTVLGYFARDRIVGALMFGAPRRKGFYNRLIAARGSISEFAGAAGSAEPFE